MQRIVVSCQSLLVNWEPNGNCPVNLKTAGLQCPFPKLQVEVFVASKFNNNGQLSSGMTKVGSLAGNAANFDSKGTSINLCSYQAKGKSGESGVI
jgi:hypothetical protein